MGHLFKSPGGNSYVLSSESAYASPVSSEILPGPPLAEEGTCSRIFVMKTQTERLGIRPFVGVLSQSLEHGSSLSGKGRTGGILGGVGTANALSRQTLEELSFPPFLEPIELSVHHLHAYALIVNESYRNSAIRRVNVNPSASRR